MNHQPMNWRLISIVAGIIGVIALFALAGGESTGQALTWLLFILVGYFVPTIVAKNRHVPNTGSIFVVNLFLGWTLIGWVVALAMAARSLPQAATPEAPGLPAIRR